MISKKINKIDLTYYYEQLSNGFKIYYLNVPNKKEYMVTLVTKYGSNNNEFNVNNKAYKKPLGIAHFLEHKNFEQESGEKPFEFYEKSGSMVNASTSFDYTAYYCAGTTNFKENLEYLLKFVSEPYYTDENVEKEQGIIAQELKMYNDNPEEILVRTLRESVFHNKPVKYDIGGTVDTIKEITKEDLYDCYNTFYSPNNMYLVITGNFDKDEAHNIIMKSNYATKNNVEFKLPEIKENDKVVVKNKTITGDIAVDKLLIGIKINRDTLGKTDDKEKRLYIKIIENLLFGRTSEFLEEAHLNNLFTYFEQYTSKVDNYTVLILNAITTEKDKLLKKIEQTLENIKIDESSFERIKKVLLADYIKGSESVEEMNFDLMMDELENEEIEDNYYETVKNLDYSTLLNILNKIDFTNKSVIIMEKNN